MCVHLAALLHHHCRCDRLFNALPYTVKAREVGGKKEGQEEPVTVTMLLGNWAVLKLLFGHIFSAHTRTLLCFFISPP